MAKILLTGATGTIGGVILRSLLAHKHPVESIVRSSAKGQSVAALGASSTFSVLELKPETLGVVKQLAKTKEVFIHTALSYTQEAIALEHQLVSTILSAGRELEAEGKPFHFIYTSGSFTCGSSSVLADESHPDNPHPVVQWRSALDHQIIDAGTNTFKTAVIRPSSVYPGDPFQQWIDSAKKKGKIYAFRNLDGHASLVYLPDLGEYFTAVVEKQGKGLFFATDGTPIKLRDIVERVKIATGVTEVELYDDPLPVIPEVGFFAVGQTIDSRLASSRTKELGWVPTYKSWLDFPLEVD